MPRRDTIVRALAIGVLSSRIAYGLGLAIAPKKLATKHWLGEGAAAPAALVPLRGVGTREVAVHGLALAAYLGGRPARPWLAVSIAGDLGDIAATAHARDGLPEGSAVATAVVAGGSAALTALVAALADC